MEQANEIRCPKCGSNQVTANQKGFSGGKALVGGILTGGVGLLAGTIGSKKIIITCLSCGNEFKPGVSNSISKPFGRNDGVKQQYSKGTWVFTKVLCIIVVVLLTMLLIGMIAVKEWTVFFVFIVFELFFILGIINANKKIKELKEKEE